MPSHQNALRQKREAFHIRSCAFKCLLAYSRVKLPRLHVPLKREVFHNTRFNKAAAKMVRVEAERVSDRSKAFESVRRKRIAEKIVSSGKLKPFQKSGWK